MCEDRTRPDVLNLLLFSLPDSARTGCARARARACSFQDLMGLVVAQGARGKSEGLPRMHAGMLLVSSSCHVRSLLSRLYSLRTRSEAREVLGPATHACVAGRVRSLFSLCCHAARRTPQPSRLRPLERDV